MKNMKALVFDGKKLQLTDVPRPTPKPNEALIRILLAGICNTDVEIVKGYMKFRGILGHEFVGVVEQAADSNWIGKRVVGEINVGCGKCEYCREGMSRHCSQRMVLGILEKDGVFAEYATLPLENLYDVPNNLDDDEAVFTEPLAAALEILEQVQVQPDSRVAIVGDGKLGQLVAQVVRLVGCELVVIGKHPSKLELLKRFSIHTCLVDSVDVPLQDIVVECSGSPEGFLLSKHLVKPRGTLVLKSTYQQSFTFNPAELVVNEINVVGSRCGPFLPALQLLKNRLVEVSYLVTAKLSLQSALEAFKLAQQAESLKILIDMCGEQ